MELLGVCSCVAILLGGRDALMVKSCGKGAREEPLRGKRLANLKRTAYAPLIIQHQI